MATVSKEAQSSSSGVNVMPLIVFGVLSLIFGLFIALAMPDFWGLFAVLPEAASREANNTDTLFQVLIGIGGAVFFLVQGLIYYAAIAFRAPANDDSDGPNMHGNLILEIVWTVIPAVIVVFLAIYAYNVWRANTDTSIAANTIAGDNISINAFGQRFSWSFEYHTNTRANVNNPDGTVSEGTGKLVVLTTPDLYVYDGQTVELQMQSRDVIHAFWAPEMRVKQDLIPGRITTIRFSPIQPNDAENPPYDGVMLVGNINLYGTPDNTTTPVLAAPVLEEGELPSPVAFDLNNEEPSADANYLAVINPETLQTAYVYLPEATAMGRFNTYRIICAELCGGDHAKMWQYIYSFESQEAFESAWYLPNVAIASIPAGNPVEVGERAITAYGCSGCHTLSALGWAGAVGPVLDGIGSRALSESAEAEEASGNELLSGAEYITQSLRNPHAYLVPPFGPLMRIFGASENPPAGIPATSYSYMPQEDLIGIVAFLCTQTGSSPADSTCGLENWAFDENGRFTADSAALTEELLAITNEYE
jgi:cytochrome c oxidase subunit 2